jgi:uncharacterized protein YegL
MTSTLTALALSAPLAIFGLWGDDEPEKTKEEIAKETGEQVRVVDDKAPAWPDANNGEETELDENMLRDNVMVVLDMSGSMAEGNCSGDFYNKSEAAKATLSEWIKSVPDESNLGLITFVNSNTDVYVDLAIGNREMFMQEVNDFSPEGGTPLYDAVTLAEDELESQAISQNGYGTYKMVVITDGEHSPGQSPNQAVNTILDNPQNPIEIHTIGFCIEDSALNQPGRTEYQSAKNPEQLKEGLDSVLSEATSFDGPESFGDWTK